MGPIETTAKQLGRVTEAAADIEHDPDRVELDVAEPVEHPPFSLAQQEIRSRLTFDACVIGRTDGRPVRTACS